MLRRIQTTLLWLAILLMIGSSLTCRLGVKYEISKIPLEKRQQMADFDWIGIDGFVVGMAVFVFAGFLFSTSMILILRLKRKLR